jgi:hypothetical protein
MKLWWEENRLEAMGCMVFVLVLAFVATMAIVETNPAYRARQDYEKLQRHQQWDSAYKAEMKRLHEQGR